MGDVGSSNVRVLPPAVRHDGIRGLSSMLGLFTPEDDKCRHLLSIEQHGKAVTVRCCISPYHDSNHVALVETDDGEGFYVSVHWRSL